MLALGEECGSVSASLDVHANLIRSHVHSLLHGRNFLLGRSEDGLAISQMSQLLLGLLDLVNLPIDESFLLGDIILDFLLKQVDGFTLVIGDFLNQIRETLNVLKWCEVNIISLALLDEVGETSFGLLNHSNLLGVGQLNW